MTSYIFLKKYQWILLICCSLLNFSSNGQAADPCQEGDCDPSIFNTKITHPLIYDASNSRQRTDDFKQLHQTITNYRALQNKKTGWQKKYQSGLLTGKSCVRYFHLMGHLGYEYEQNPDFKAYVDTNDPDAANFTKNAFEGCRRTFNLQLRLNKGCPKDLQEVKDTGNPAFDDLRDVYMKLGQVLGYFDKDGNIIKPLEVINNDVSSTDQPQLSKRQQVKQLENTIAQLPVGQQTQDKVNGVKNSLNSFSPKISNLKNILSGFTPRLGSLLPKGTGLLSKLGALNNALGLIKNFTPKVPNLNLMNRLSGLFQKGKDLESRAKNLVDKSKKLKNRFDGLTKKADDTKKKIDKHTKNIQNLSQTLDKLKKDKTTLEERLKNRPKKYLEELTQLVNKADKEAKGLVKNIDIEKVAKDELEKQLDKLLKDKDEVKKKLEDLEKIAENLTNEKVDFEDAVNKILKEVDDIKLQEAVEEAKENMKKKLADLIPEDVLKGKIDVCNEETQQLFTKLQGVEKLQGDIETKIDNASKTVLQKVADKLSNITNLQNNLKIGQNGTPVVENTITKIDNLLAKGTTINSTIEVITGKSTGLQGKIKGIGNKINLVKNKIETFKQKQGNLDNELTKLVTEKLDLTSKINGITKEFKPVEGLVDDFVKRYKALEEKIDCDESLKKDIETIEEEQKEVEPEVNELEEEVEKIEEEVEKLNKETVQIEELQRKEFKLKEEFGKDITLQPVPAKEWKESFEVKRPYWEATFHPDNEVVEGMKGRYFIIKLKDADKNVKLLFEPGKYYMDKSKFRDTYGSTIGIFVTETLNAMSETERENVKLFIQGSADIVGNSTFRGNMNSKYLYNNVDVLPQNEDTDDFSNGTKTLEIPEKSFRNSDLPNLRGQFLKEMIMVYSSKLDPIILEGEVKQVTNKEDRNAIIYLFIPEAFITTE